MHTLRGDERGQKDPVWPLGIAIVGIVAIMLAPEGAWAIGGRVVTDTPTSVPPAWVMIAATAAALVVVYVGAKMDIEDRERPFIRDAKREDDEE